MGCGAEVAHVAPPAPGKCGMEGKATYFLCFFGIFGGVASVL